MSGQDVKELFATVAAGAPPDRADVDRIVWLGRRRRRMMVGGTVAAVAVVVAGSVGLLVGAGPSRVAPAPAATGTVAPTRAATPTPTPTTAPTPSPTPTASTVIEQLYPSAPELRIVAVGKKVRVVGDSYLYLTKNGYCRVTPDGTTPIGDPAITWCKKDDGNQARGSVSMQGGGALTSPSSTQYAYVISGLILAPGAATATVAIGETVLPAVVVRLPGAPSFAAYVVALGPGSKILASAGQSVTVYDKDGKVVASMVDPGMPAPSPRPSTSDLIAITPTASGR